MDWSTQLATRPGPEEYRRYLSSQSWQRLTRKTKHRDQYRCQDCGTRPALMSDLHTHHLTYVFKGAESLWHLITVCDRCHKIRHAEHFRRGDRLGEYLQRDHLGGNTAWRRENWPQLGFLRPAAELTWEGMTRREQSFYASAILMRPDWHLMPPPDAAR